MAVLVLPTLSPPPQETFGWRERLYIIVPNIESKKLIEANLDEHMLDYREVKGVT